MGSGPAKSGQPGGLGYTVASMGASVSLSDQPFHPDQNVPDFGNKLVQHRYDRLKFHGSFSIAEKYIQGRLGILIQLEAALPKRPDNGLPVLMDQGPRVVTTDRGPVLAHSVWAYNYAISQGDQPKYGVEHCVLVQNIEVVKVNERCTNPVWISLHTDEKILSVLTRCFYSFAMGFVVDPIASVDRESGVFVLRTAINPDQLPERMLQG